MDGSFPNRPGEGYGDEGYRPRKGGFRGTAENARTKICLRWKNGSCRFGDRCNFAHGEEALRKLPPRDQSFGRGGVAGGPSGGGRGFAGAYDNAFGEGFGGAASRSSAGALQSEFYGEGGGGGTGGPGGAYGEGYGGGFPTSAGAGYIGQQQGGAGPGGLGDAHPAGAGAGLSSIAAAGGADPQMWAAQGYPTTGPGGWTQYRTPDTNEPYYHNHRTGVTVWDKPPGWDQ